MSTNEYLLILANGKSYKPLQEIFRQIDGFYNGIGYAFPVTSEQELRKIIAPLKICISRMPLEPGQDFKSFRQSFKAVFFRNKLIEKELELLAIKARLGLESINAETLESVEIENERKETILEIVQECDRLRQSIEWAEGIEKVLSINPKPFHLVKFICENSQNYLLEDSSDIPKLVNFIDSNGASKAFIRKGIVGMVVGAGGVGKTHFLTQLALSIVTGTPFLNKYPVETPGAVFLGLGENSEEDIHRLLRKTFKTMFLKSKEEKELQNISQRLAVTSFTGVQSTFIQKDKPTALFEWFLNELKEKEPELGWSCIILDPISRFLGADAETDNAAATQFISLLERLTLELKGKPTVLFGHHMNKLGVSNTNTDQAAARGASAITDGVRWQANLDKIEKKQPNKTNEEGESKYERNKIILRVVKSNFTTIPPAQTLLKDENGCLHLLKEEQRIQYKELQF